MHTPPPSAASVEVPTITIFEWVNGGGLSETSLAQIPNSWLAEGQAMLLTLISGLAAAGIKLIVPLDVRLLSRETLHQIGSQAQIVDLSEQPPSAWLEVWCQLASGSTWSWLVAPESEGILRSVAAKLRLAGAQLLNADNDFLEAASDKLCCAHLLHQAGVAHPPTQRLDAIDDAWLSQFAYALNVDQTSGRRGQEHWIVKPIDGAGGEGLQIVSRDQLLYLQDNLAGANSESPTMRGPQLIVQPRVNGIAASCSAIVDCSGRAHWLPVVSQDFSLSNPQQFKYLGCTYPAPDIPTTAPIELLQKTLCSLPGSPWGWIGVDLIFDPAADYWWVVEINPRCTSSMVGLGLAYAGNLVYDCFRLQTGLHRQLSAPFAPIVFRVDKRRAY